MTLTLGRKRICFALAIVGLMICGQEALASDCPGDANGDGTVDPLDSGFVLARFGCPVGTGNPDCDAADQNQDGAVDPLDSGFVLARFGPCPTCVKPAKAGEDCWTTRCGEGTQFDFSTAVIPADFFFPGSDPFDGVVNLGGVDLFEDTILDRLDDMCFDGALPVTAISEITITKLNLKSCEQIEVTGVFPPQLWDMEVSLDGPQDLGLIEVTKIDADGGTFDTDFPIRAEFTFKRLGVELPFSPGETWMFESTAQPWAQNEPPFFALFCGPPDRGFYPGVSPGDVDCCDVEVCHENFGDPSGHLHCTVPPKCQGCKP